MKNTAAGWGAARNYRVFIWERFAGIRGTRGLAAGTWGDLRGLMQIADLTSRNMAAPRLDRRRAAEPVRRTSSAALRRRFRRALEKGQSTDSRGDVSRETIVISFCFSRNDSSFRPETRPSPLYCVILRSLRRRISARGEWVGLEIGRFFASLRMTSWRRNGTCSSRNSVKKFHVKQFLIPNLPATNN